MNRLCRLALNFGMITAAVCLAVAQAGGQGLQPVSGNGSNPAAGTIFGQTPHAPGASGGAMSSQPMSKPLPGVPADGQTALSSSGAPRVAPSMLDEPAASAKIEVTGDSLSILATNASLSELIRQVAAKTGMQVEGNSRDERVFGAYGPGNPEEVLTALLYDSGYNVMMVGSMADGAPRRLVLSSRGAVASTQQAAPPVRSNDEDDEAEPPAEVAQPAPPPPPGGPPTPGQVRTPQQMLEELQRMHMGQTPPDVPKEQ